MTEKEGAGMTKRGEGGNDGEGASGDHNPVTLNGARATTRVAPTVGGRGRGECSVRGGGEGKEKAPSLCGREALCFIGVGAGRSPRRDAEGSASPMPY